MKLLHGLQQKDWTDTVFNRTQLILFTPKHHYKKTISLNQTTGFLSVGFCDQLTARHGRKTIPHTPVMLK